MAAIFRTQKTYGTANSYEVRIDDNSPIEGPYTVIARDLNHAEALFLSALLNDKGWDHMTAYNAVSALVENDSLHDYLFKAMQAQDHPVIAQPDPDFDFDAWLWNGPTPVLPDVLARKAARSKAARKAARTRQFNAWLWGKGDIGLNFPA